MSTVVSRPGMDVYCGVPLRISRQTGALLPGCACWRCISACAGFCSGGGVDCCAMPAGASIAKFRTTTKKKRTCRAIGFIEALYSARVYSFWVMLRALSEFSQLFSSPCVHFSGVYKAAPGALLQGFVSGLPWYLPCL